ncbi:PAS domain S-box protein [Halobellus ordinarius]|uniref:PAS domain S-box protein n=1 Tax=Halobellus ordinarius TaxID=3075120 RepID=UPI00288085E9|nr:PAS domain S-box protein [Halobellus sp. ZY16]
MELPRAAYRAAFDDAPDGLAIVDPETGTIRDCNRRYRELHGGEECRGQDVTDHVVPIRDGDGGLLDRLGVAATDDEPINCRLRAAESVPVELRPSSITVEAADLLLVRVTEIEDETEERRDRKRKARAIDEAPIGITITDPAQADNPLVYVNDEFERLTGYSAGEALGRNCRFLQGPETDPARVAELREAIDAEEPGTVELRNYRNDGSEFWNRVTIAPVHDETGELVNFVGFQADITAQRQDRAELELAHELLETVPSGVARTDPSAEGGFEYVNPALVSLLGAESAEQLHEHSFADFYVDPSERTKLLEALFEGETDHVSRETRLETLDGDIADVIITASVSEDDSGDRHVHKIIQDITERKSDERALERYERLVESLPIGVYQNTPGSDGTFTLLNDAMADIFDADSKAELRQQPVRDLYVDPEEREAFSERLREEGAVTEAELKLRTLSGEELWAAVTAIARETEEGTVFDGVLQDITRRKETEQRLKEQRDNLDILNQVLRHDIRNDLQLVTAYTDFLGEHVDEEGEEYVETIRQSADHAVELTRTARDIADVMLTADRDRHRVDLWQSLESELDEVRSKHSGAAITVTGSVPEISVVADEMLDSVFRNLLTNAIQHNDSTIPEVDVAVEERPETALISIADNGPGIPDRQKEGVFGKGEKGLESSGTGIGLYLVETLVEAYGGDVWVEDNDPRGAVFFVELPKVESADS